MLKALRHLLQLWIKCNDTVLHFHHWGFIEKLLQPSLVTILLIFHKIHTTDTPHHAWRFSSEFKFRSMCALSRLQLETVLDLFSLSVQRARPCVTAQRPLWRGHPGQRQWPANPSRPSSPGHLLCGMWSQMSSGKRNNYLWVFMYHEEQSQFYSIACFVSERQEKYAQAHGKMPRQLKP